jgi:peptidoglycan/xylan/chitin deacetylase (PgdA/CDA1 family)
MKVKLALVIGLLLLLISAGFPDNAPEATPLPAPTLNPDSRLVALYFDDAFVNQYQEALPVLLQYEFRATFGVITGSIGTGKDLMEYMDEAELKTLAGYGMEIASHTRTHPHLAGALTDGQLQAEIAGSKQDLEEMGFNVATLAYPYYEYDDRIIGCARAAGYACARAGWSAAGAYDLNTSDPLARYRISAWQMSNQDMATFKLYLDKASRTSVVCLVYHFISDAGPVDTSTSLAGFHAQMAYLHDNGYAVILLSELINQ